MSSSEFNKAQANVAKLTVDPGNETKLKLYGLFKQVIFFCYYKISLYLFYKLRFCVFKGNGW